MTASPTSASDIVISCRNVWKVFGDRPERLRLTPATTMDELRATNHIAAVRDVSFAYASAHVLGVALVEALAEALGFLAHGGELGVQGTEEAEGDGALGPGPAEVIVEVAKGGDGGGGALDLRLVLREPAEDADE